MRALVTAAVLVTGCTSCTHHETPAPVQHAAVTPAVTKPTAPAPTPQPKPAPAATSKTDPAPTGDALADIAPLAPYVIPPPDAQVTFSATRPFQPAVPAAEQDFSVATQPAGCTVAWTIDGPAAAPAKGTGGSIHVSFTAPGMYTVTATCGDVTRERIVSLCDYAGALASAAGYYGTSNDFAGVTVIFAKTLSGASWTAHDRVTIGDGVLDNDRGCPDPSHYVHEFGHVWEYQHGQNQLANGAKEQLANLVTNVYDYGGARGARQAVLDGRKLETFNLEQQAELFANDYYFKQRHASGQYAEDLDALTKPALAQPPTVK